MGHRNHLKTIKHQDVQLHGIGTAGQGYGGLAKRNMEAGKLALLSKI